MESSFEVTGNRNRVYAGVLGRNSDEMVQKCLILLRNRRKFVQICPDSSRFVRMSADWSRECECDSGAVQWSAGCARRSSQGQSDFVHRVDMVNLIRTSYLYGSQGSSVSFRAQATDSASAISIGVVDEVSHEPAFRERSVLTAQGPSLPSTRARVVALLQKEPASRFTKVGLMQAGHVVPAWTRGPAYAGATSSRAYTPISSGRGDRKGRSGLFALACAHYD